MKKKIAGILLVLVLVVCLFFVGGGVILMLAPGLELFGIRYVGGGTSDYYEKLALSNLEGDSIYIETHGVPVKISYVTTYTSEAELRQNFAGFSKSKYDTADLKVYLDENKNTHIETREMKKWLIGSKGEEYLNVNLSIIYAQNKNLYINSASSKINVVGNAIYKDFSVITGGAVNVEGSIKAENVKYHSGAKITINDKISAKNYDLKSTGSSIDVTQDVLGDLTVATKGGDVKFVSCNNLKATTGGGNIKTYGSGLNSVRGGATITTSGGDIILGNVATVNENALCNITSVSGDVHISTMKNGNITSDRGKININKARAIVVNSKVNSVNVENVSEEIVVNGRNGNVSLGLSGVVNNVKVYTTTGKINVRNAGGKVHLESRSNTVDFINLSSEDITIISGRDAELSNLQGKVYIKSNGDIDASFFGITDNITIETGTKTDRVNVNGGKTSYLDVDFDIVSTKGKIAKVYVGDNLYYENSKINTGSNAGKHKISIKTSYAKVVVKLSV